MVPIIGPLIVPVFGAIAANIYGFRYHIENPPNHYSQKEEVEEEEFVWFIFVVKAELLA